MRSSRRIRAARWWVGGLLVVLMLGAAGREIVLACNNCQSQPGCLPCELRSALMYAKGTTPSENPGSPDSTSASDPMKILVQDPVESYWDKNGNGQPDPDEPASYVISVQWYAGTTGDVKRWCFWRLKGGGEVGDYTLKSDVEQDVTATAAYGDAAGTGNQAWVKFADGSVLRHDTDGKLEIMAANGQVIARQTASLYDEAGEWAVMGTGDDTYDVSGSEPHSSPDGTSSPWPTQVTQKRDGQEIRETHFKVIEDAGHVARKRTTVVEFNSDHNPPATVSRRLLTTVNVYNGAGQLYFVVEPEGVRQYLAANGYGQGVDPDHPGAPCGLDTASETELKRYASVVYDAYDDQGRVTQVTGHGKGGCCEGGDLGTTLLSYGVNPDYGTPDDAQKWNLWKTYKRIQSPSGLKTMEFYTEQGNITCRVVLEMGAGNTILRRWITHSLYYASDGELGYRKGGLKEVRHPSACANYTLTEDPNAAGWPIQVAEVACANGLVEMYEYDSASGEVARSKVGQGTGASANPTVVRRYEYTSTTYGGTTTYRVSKETAYPTPWGGSGAEPSDKQETTYDYTYYKDEEQNDTHEVESKTVTYPVVQAAANGSGTATSVRYHYVMSANSSQYYNDWTMHEDGTYSFTGVGTSFPGLSQVVQTIEDVDTTRFSTGLPDGWAARSGGAHRVTSYEYYATGSPTLLKATTSASGQKTVYAYLCQRKTDESGKETTTSLVTLWVPNMLADGSYARFAACGFEQANITDLAGRMTFVGQGDAMSCFDGDLTNDWDGSQDAIWNGAFLAYPVSGTAYVYNPYSAASGAGKLASMDRDCGDPGSVGNKLTTVYAYNAASGLLEKTKGPDGTITMSVFDPLGRTTVTYMGTCDGKVLDNVATTDLAKTAETFYDEAAPGSGTSGTGDGNATQSKVYCDATHAYATVFNYDYQGRQTASLGPDSAGTFRSLDGLGRTTTASTCVGCTLSSGTITAGPLRALSVTRYDPKGQVYQTVAYAVTNGVAGRAMTTSLWYDEWGRQIKGKDTNGLFSKTLYDTVGRTLATYLSYDAGEADTAYAAAKDVASDIVIEQTRYDYDVAGNVWLTRHFQRQDNADSTTGELQDPATQPMARVTYSVAWFDPIGRTVKSVSYGTNDGVAITSRTESDCDPETQGVQAYGVGGPAANTSDKYIVTMYQYDACDSVYYDLVTDNRGVTRQTYRDMLGRTTQVVENYGGLGPITEYSYDAAGRLARIRVCQSGSPCQDTTYHYADTDADTSNDGLINRSWLTAVVYPGSGDTVTVANNLWTLTGDTGDHISTTFDYTGRPVTRTDQRGTVHTYSYDSAGRLEEDVASTLGGNTDNYIRGITFAYDIGRGTKVTSYTDTGCTTAANETAWVYDGMDVGDFGWGGVKSSRQAHGGATDGFSPHVDYTYADGAAGDAARYARLSKVTYPGPATRREVFYNFPSDGGIGDHLSRLDTMAGDAQGTAWYARYAYLGAGTIINETRPTVNTLISLSYGTGGTYGGFDRFGRVVDQMWALNTLTPIDEYKYGYDRGSNRLWRENSMTHGSSPVLDEYYTYDTLGRLTYMKLGTLTGNPYSGIASTPSREEGYTLDALGNWAGYTRTTAGTVTLNQTRSHNAANEIAAISGGSWAAAAYDAAGNMTAAPRPGSETTQLDLTHDAWNRLVKVVDHATSATVAEYRFDGLGRRIAKLTPNTTNSAHWDRTDYYYNESWQCLEERKATNQADKETVATAPYCQYLWGIRYVDAPVLRWRSVCGTLDEMLYYCNDANMNVTALMSNNSVAERYTYTPYGSVTVCDGSWTPRQGNTSAYANEILYCGYRYDPETGLYHVRNRMFHPAVGRWMERDPKQAELLQAKSERPAERLKPLVPPNPLDKGSMREMLNLLEYVRGNPAGYQDASGLGMGNVHYDCEVVSLRVLTWPPTFHYIWGDCDCTGPGPSVFLQVAMKMMASGLCEDVARTSDFLPGTSTMQMQAAMEMGLRAVYTNVNVTFAVWAHCITCSCR